MIDRDSADPTEVAKPSGGVFDYLAIARFDHSTKHIFIIPGIVFAYVLRGLRTDTLITNVILGFAAAACIASANYVINEWLDRESDRHHPTKSQRSAVQKDLSGSFVALEWALFVALGLFLAYILSKATFVIACIFAIQGIVYNVPPIRSKDRAYVDVISESINNPLRLMIGWSMVDPATLPPGSIIIAYWFGGAFLMAAKRLSEYIEIANSHGIELLSRYRVSFARYTNISLTVSCFVYAMLSSFFLSIFLMKYRIEYVILMPFVTVLFAYYLIISLRPGSSAQKPEKLFVERGLMAIVAVLSIIFLIATFIDIPWLDSLTEQRFIALP